MDNLEIIKLNYKLTNLKYKSSQWKKIFDFERIRKQVVSNYLFEEKVQPVLSNGTRTHNKLLTIKI